MKTALFALLVLSLVVGCSNSGGNQQHAARVASSQTTAPPQQGTTSTPTASQAPGSVPLIAQEERYWCWAASAQMLLTYYGASPVPSQCQQASDRLNGGPTSSPWCCDSANRGGEFCNNGGFPHFEYYGYDSTTTSDGDTRTWDDIRNDLKAGKPFAFSHKYPDGTSHFLVAASLDVNANGDELIAVNDPVYPNGDTYDETYNDYVAVSGGEHLRDYYDIRNTKQ